MQNVITWVKNNKLATILGAVLLFILFKNTFGGFRNLSVNNRGLQESLQYGTDSIGVRPQKMDMTTSIVPPYPPVTPQPQIQDRKVVTNATTSLVVKNVKESVKKITDKAFEVGGYMVNTSVSEPTEGGSGFVLVRVPADKLSEMLSFLKENSLRVTHEDVYGNDVTDQYVDIDERLAVLTANKARMQEILDQATTIENILKIQQSIFQLQDQIDSLQGQLNYLEATSQTSLLTINLATDEYALPYAPDQPWSPENVFKLAVRSLVLTLRGIANWLIWAVVYLPIAAPIALLAWYFYRKSKTVN